MRKRPEKFWVVNVYSQSSNAPHGPVHTYSVFTAETREELWGRYSKIHPGMVVTASPRKPQ